METTTYNFERVTLGRGQLPLATDRLANNGRGNKEALCHH